jgi:hypothetical protein
MQKKYFSIIAIAAVLGLPACSKFLNREPISSYTEDNYYRNTQEVETGVYGCYASLRDVYNQDYILAGLRSDDAYISESEGDINQIDGFVETPTNSYVASYWQLSYNVVRQCNTVLKNLGNVTDPVKKKYFEGEAKFLRAHMFFNLVRLYGDIPLVTASVTFDDTASVRRKSKDLVYAQIIQDFRDAINLLPASWTSADLARVTTGAAKGMLAKVYMTQQNYTAARTLLLDLLNNPGPYQLLPNYKNIFGINNEMNAEILYAVRFKSASNGLGNTFTYNMDKLSGSVGFRAASDFRGNTPFPNADSVRKSQTFLTGGTYGTSYYTGGKYQDPAALKNDGGNDFIVLRYADIILLYAEAENELNGNTPLTAADATNPASRLFQLNRIRTRAANGVPAAVPVYAFNATAVNSQTNFRNTIKAERRREFGEEDQRWYDLLRWNDAVTAMNAHFQSRSSASFIPPVVKDYQVLYPIPQREIDVTNHIVTQNPGY